MYNKCGFNNESPGPKPDIKPVGTGLLKHVEVDPEMKIIISRIFDNLYDNEKYKL